MAKIKTSSNFDNINEMQDFIGVKQESESASISSYETKQILNILFSKKIHYICFLLVSLITLQLAPVFAMDYEDLNSVKDPAYRVGTTDDVEQKADKLVNPTVVKKTKEVEQFADIEKLTYADLSIKKISMEIAQDLDLDYDDMMQDLSLLWQGAASRSDIIKFALYKLSNPDKDKPDDKSVKKVLQTIASMSTLLAAGAGSTAIAGSSFIGGNILGIMSQDDKAVNYKFTKVNDADMIILVRKINDLQQKVVNSYYDYNTTRNILEMTTKMSQDRYQNYKLAMDSDDKDLILVTDAYYRESLDMQMKARSEFYSKRASLEQLVGNETFTQFEKSLGSRGKGSK